MSLRFSERTEENHGENFSTQPNRYRAKSESNTFQVQKQWPQLVQIFKQFNCGQEKYFDDEWFTESKIDGLNILACNTDQLISHPSPSKHTTIISQ
jgi:hypothetical protein